MNSIQKQTYQEWECLLVDAGSDSDTAQFMATLCQSDPRFRVIKVNNIGASGNRNVALQRCQAEFVTFIDADDEVVPTFFAEALQLVKKDPTVDIVVGTTVTCKNYREISSEMSLSESMSVENKVQKEQLLSYLIAGIPTRDDEKWKEILVGRVYPKLIRTTLAQTVGFDEYIIVHEDNLFSLATFELARKIIIVPKVWYKYHIHLYSITHATETLALEMKKLTSELQFAKQMTDMVSSSKYNLDKAALGIRLVNTLLNYVYGIVSRKHLQKKVAILWESNLLNTIPQVDYSKYEVTFKQKLLLNTNGFVRKLVVRAMILVRGIKLVLKELYPKSRKRGRS